MNGIHGDSWGPEVTLSRWCSEITHFVLVLELISFKWQCVCKSWYFQNESPIIIWASLSASTASITEARHHFTAQVACMTAVSSQHLGSISHFVCPFYWSIPFLLRPLSRILVESVLLEESSYQVGSIKSICRLYPAKAVSSQWALYLTLLVEGQVHRSELKYELKRKWEEIVGNHIFPAPNDVCMSNWNTPDQE